MREQIRPHVTNADGMSAEAVNDAYEKLLLRGPLRINLVRARRGGEREQRGALQRRHRRAVAREPRRGELAHIQAEDELPGAGVVGIL